MARYLSLFDGDVDVEKEVETRRQSNVTLRPYQRDAVNAVYERWDAGDRATLVCLPTGTGKSVVFSDVMGRWVGR